MWRWAVCLLLLPGCTFDRSGLAFGEGPVAADLPGATDSVADGPSVVVDGLSADLAPLDGGNDQAADAPTADDVAVPVDVSLPDLGCTGGAQRPCYTGPAATEGVGECKAGAETCSLGVWGPCTGEVTPQAESCDSLDNDCDGTADEALSQTCAYSGPAGTLAVGECKAGTQSCAGGAWGTCTGEVTPQAESCDNLDNDCDGTTDEGFSFKCDDITCSGTGLIDTVSNLCVDDYGTSGSSDKLEIYCCDGVARFCLSEETCPWRGGCGSTTDTCSRAGLTSDHMATVTCTSQKWNGHTEYYCSPTNQIYF